MANNNELTKTTITLLSDLLQTKDYVFVYPVLQVHPGIDLKQLFPQTTTKINTQVGSTPLTTEQIIHSWVNELKANNVQDVQQLTALIDAINKYTDNIRTIGYIQPQKSVLIQTLNAMLKNDNTAEQQSRLYKKLGLISNNDQEDNTDDRSNVALTPSDYKLIQDVVNFTHAEAKINKLTTEKAALESKRKAFDDDDDIHFYENLSSRINEIKAELKELKGLTSNESLQIINEFADAFCSNQFIVSRFDDSIVYTHEYKNPLTGRETNITSTDPRAMMRVFVKDIAPQARAYGRLKRFIELIVSLYPIDDRGCYDKAMDETQEDETINKFADLIDSQCGEGAFAAYCLYPLFYTEPEKYGITTLGIKRQFVTGVVASTGKSILGKCLKYTYRDSLVHEIGQRPEQHGDYTAGRNAWNTQIVDKKIILIDDDNANNAKLVISRSDFYKNLYAYNALDIGTAGREGKATFEGFAYSNVNSFGTDFDTPEVSKRVYILHLYQKVNDYLTPEEIGRLYSMQTDDCQINRDALINRLNRDKAKAIDWLMNYEQPESIGNNTLTPNTDAYNAVAFIIEHIAKVAEQNPNKQRSWCVPLKYVANFMGGFISGERVTSQVIDTISNGRLECAKVGYKDTDEDGKTKYIVGKGDNIPRVLAVRLAKGITIEDGFPDVNTDDITSTDETTTTNTTEGDVRTALLSTIVKRSNDKMYRHYSDEIVNLFSVVLDKGTGEAFRSLMVNDLLNLLRDEQFQQVIRDKYVTSKDMDANRKSYINHGVDDNPFGEILDENGMPL